MAYFTPCSSSGLPRTQYTNNKLNKIARLMSIVTYNKRQILIVKSWIIGMLLEYRIANACSDLSIITLDDDQSKFVPDLH